ncbi:MAG: site-2 protease family protein [Myxococcales bacterium]|nr:site-2 protease family protein [Myxococcales bacterium]
MGETTTFRPIKLGRLFGFPIELRWSFLALLALVLLTSGGLIGLAYVLVAFTSVLAHELGHALVARRLGVGVSGIDLHFFGGAAKLSSMPKSSRDEVLIAAAGPAVSFAIAALAGLGYLLSGSLAVATLALINLVLGAFNLLPALPMDGGRIFRALLSRRLGRIRATEISVTVARVTAVALGLVGVLTVSVFLVGLAVLLWMMASAELRAAPLWRYIDEEPAGPTDAQRDLFERFARRVRDSARRPAAPSEPPSEPTVEVLDQDGTVVHRSGERPRRGTTGPHRIIITYVR